MKKPAKIVLALLAGAIIFDAALQIYWSQDEAIANVYSWLDQQAEIEDTFGSKRDYDVTKQITLFSDQYTLYTIAIDGTESTGVVTVKVDHQTGKINLASLEND
ncbi:MAG: hypothetical protein HUJ31_08570 [Pseudomonadales bacterium]|nr:hypothetical protein [Pseudomonadales bacterium]